jgi:hypothetical protein
MPPTPVEIPEYSEWSLEQRHAVAIEHLKYAEQEHFRQAIKIDEYEEDSPERRAIEHFARVIEKASGQLEKIEQQARAKGMDVNAMRERHGSRSARP